MHTDVSGRSRHISKEGNIKMYLEQVGWDRVKWIELPQDEKDC